MLDINVLLALLDATHTFHRKAHLWWAANSATGWASCPLTENGTVRIMTNPAYSVSRRFSVPEVVAALMKFTDASDHEFWPDELTLRDDKTFDTSRIHGGRQLTNLYLLSLAFYHGGRFITFDQGIPLVAVKKATASSICVL